MGSKSLGSYLFFEQEMHLVDLICLFAGYIVCKLGILCFALVYGCIKCYDGSALVEGSPSSV